MMATLDQVVTRTVFVHPDSDPANLWPTHRLLADLGHEVTAISTLDEAVDLMRDDSVDLLILEEGSNSNRQDTLRQIGALPASQQPREIAIFSDRPDEPVVSPQSGSSRVHVLLKPLHMHGLLQLVRQLDSRLGHASL